MDTYKKMIMENYIANQVTKVNQSKIFLRAVVT